MSTDSLYIKRNLLVSTRSVFVDGWLF